VISIQPAASADEVSLRYLPNLRTTVSRGNVSSRVHNDINSMIFRHFD
jgi:hypothetical protein